VVDIPVEDRDAAETKLRPGVPRRDCDIVEEAEAHGPVCSRVMPGRTYQREAAALGRGDRTARGQQRRLKARLRGEGVRVDPGRLGDPADAGNVLLAVAAQHCFHGRGLDLVELECLKQGREPRR